MGMKKDAGSASATCYARHFRLRVAQVWENWNFQYEAPYEPGARNATSGSPHNSLTAGLLESVELARQRGSAG